jgi:hypothetical protein
MNFLSLFLLLVLPFNVEFLLRCANNQGNMGMHGVYLEIYRTRNILYFSLLVLLCSCFSKYIYYGLLAFIVSLYIFLKSVNSWKTIILYNLTIKNNNFDSIDENDG